LGADFLVRSVAASTAVGSCEVYDCVWRAMAALEGWGWRETDDGGSVEEGEV
jgi:hypothetical protein